MVLIGVVDSISSVVHERKKETLTAKCIPLLWFATCFLGMIHTDSNVNKTAAIYPAAIILAVDGIIFLTKLLHDRKVVFAICLIYYSCCFLFFEKYYFTEYFLETYPMDLFEVDISDGMQFIRNDYLLAEREVYTTHNPIYLAWFDLLPPFDYGDAEETKVYQNYLCCRLPEIDAEYVYVVRNNYGEYMTELRAAGFCEEKFEGYSVFFYR